MLTKGVWTRSPGRARFRACLPDCPGPLKKKRNALAYERAQIETRLKSIASEISTLDYSLRILDPAWAPPKRPSRPQRPPRFPFGLVARACLKLLPEHPGTDTTAFAELVAAECKVEFVTRDQRFVFASAVAMALRRHQRRGLAMVTGKDANSGTLRWRARLMDERRASPRGR
jgi:hypothetical protein